MHCLLVGIIGTGLFMLTPDAVAHGGAGKCHSTHGEARGQSMITCFHTLKSDVSTSP
jgi:hypothetical protein